MQWQQVNALVRLIRLCSYGCVRFAAVLLIVIMERIHTVNNVDQHVEVLASAEFVVEVKAQCDSPDAGQSDACLNDPFLDLYSRFTGVSKVDRLSWRTRSFEDAKISD
jgi:hypothetical protein